MKETWYSLLLVFSTLISSISQVLLKKSADRTYKNRIREYLNPLVVSAYLIFVISAVMTMVAYKVVSISAGAMLVSAGASALQEAGTQTLKDSILSAEKSAAEKILPFAEKDLTDALNAWKAVKNHLSDTGYDLKPEDVDEETVYIIRTDLK